MNLFTLSGHYLKQQWLNTLLNVLLLGLGFGLIVFLLLVQAQLIQKFQKDIRGIKMVVGAKGSPLQLILCNVYHLDNPTGNIALSEVQKIVQNPRMVRKAIPLSLGDNYQGFRIVGSNADFIPHYQAKIAEGKNISQSMEVVLGAKVAEDLGLKIGDEFTSSHGLQDDENEAMAHEVAPYRVVGFLAPNNSALDRLIITSLTSFWQVHELEYPQPEKGLVDVWTVDPKGLDITALLITEYANPMAAIMLPRQLSQIGNLQSAAPAYEFNRLVDRIGIGANTLKVFAGVLLLVSVLSTFVALYNALKNRQYDLSVMRTLGASRSQLFRQVLIEASILTSLGIFWGLLLGHGSVAFLGTFSSLTENFAFRGDIFLWDELYWAGIIFSLGILAALIPAYQSYRSEVGLRLKQRIN